MHSRTNGLRPRVSMVALGGFAKGSLLWDAHVASTVIDSWENFLKCQGNRGLQVCNFCSGTILFHPVFTGLQESASDNGFEELGRLVNG